MKKPRLFVFGDSWAFNYFSKEIKIKTQSKQPRNVVPHFGHDCVKGYAIKYNYFGHWIDHMEYFYEVYSYAIGGASNEQIIYQIGNLPEYKNGDRIIIIFAPPERFTWICDNTIKTLTPNGYLYNNNFTDDFIKIIENQYVNRYDVWMDAHQTNEQKFLSLLPTFLEKYKPILTSWYKETSEKVKCIEYINRNGWKSIYEDTLGKCNDHHLGVGGNYELFKFFADKLNLDIKNYTYEIKEFNKLL